MKNCEKQGKVLKEYRNDFEGKDFLTVDEACEYLGFSKSYMYKLTMERAIPHYKLSRRKCLFKRTEISEWVESCRVSTDEELNVRAQKY